MTDREYVYMDILSAPERAQKALERIDMDQLPDKDLKALQRRTTLFVSAMQELAVETEQQEQPELEVAD